jgi:hypothetical protein
LTKLSITSTTYDYVDKLTIFQGQIDCNFSKDRSIAKLEVVLDFIEKWDKFVIALHTTEGNLEVINTIVEKRIAKNMLVSI